ncbi:MAG: ABC transporter substrate-binding protein [Microbacterium sp.]|uniref:ABC transporter substrate-binding protein n=1 Tax=Microbacterium sp. TaxID=51671 RepID=UPI0039E52565
MQFDARAWRSSKVGIPRWGAVIGATALVMVALAACGSGGSDDASGGTTDITVLRSTGSTFEALYIAQEQGYFEDAGLNVTIEAGASDTSQNVPSVLNGEAQFAMTDIGGLAKAVASGLEVESVVQIQASSADIEQSDGLLVAADSDITSPSELSGKTVGLPVLGGNLQMVAMYSVEKAGGDPTSVNWVALPTASLLDSLQSGQVDAISSFSTYYSEALAAGAVSIDKGGQELLGDPQSLIFASSSWLADNADTAEAFVDAYIKGAQYANDNPDAVRAVDTEYTEMDADTIANRALQAFDWAFDVDAVDLAAQNFLDFGIIDTAISSSDLLWSEAPTD